MHIICHAGPRPARGFTLIELLVVIAIIAILAAILFPVFAKAREKANQTQCLSNQRQIAAGILMFAQDHDETFPAADAWVQGLVDSAGLVGKVWDCPSTSAVGTEGGTEYLFNNTLAGMALGDCGAPAEMPMTVDGEHTSSPTEPSTTIFYTLNDLRRRHNGQAVVSFADGHMGTSENAWAFSAKLWWKADAGVVTNAASEVSKWLDQSGNQNDGLTQTTAPAGPPPLLIKNAIGSLPVVRFPANASDYGQYLQFVEPITSIRTVVWVLRSEANLTPAQATGMTLLGDSTNYYFTGGSPYVYVPALTDYSLWGRPFCHAYLWTSRLNGKEVPYYTARPTTLAVLSAYASNGIALQANNFARDRPVNAPSLAPYQFRGDLAELLIFEKMLSGSELSGVEDYLMKKWQISN